MITIDMKKVGDAYVSDDMNPYSEYVHQHIGSKPIVQAQSPQPIIQLCNQQQPQAIQHINEMFDGMEAMISIGKDIFSRIQKLKV